MLHADVLLLQALLGEHLYGTVAEEPDADVGEEEMGLRQLAERGYRRLLQHIYQL